MEDDLQYLRVVLATGKILLLQVNSKIVTPEQRSAVVARYIGHTEVKEWKWLTGIEGKTEQFRMQMATWPLLEQVWEHMTPYYKRHVN